MLFRAKEDEKFGNSSRVINGLCKTVVKVLYFIFGGLAGALFLKVCVLTCCSDNVPSEEKAFYQIKGYWKLDQYQKVDVRALCNTYGIGSMLGGLVEEGMKTMDLEIADIYDEWITAENGRIIDFTDFNNVSFDGDSYEIKKIDRYGKERYEELGVYSKDISTFGKKDVLELSFEKKEGVKDSFIIIINANGNMFFVPPTKMRTEKNGNIYWMAYPLYLTEDKEEMD